MAVTPPIDTRVRATPVITATNESYAVEVVGRYDAASRQLTGSIRRHDLRGATATGPDEFPVDYTAAWTGSFGLRCLTSGGSGANMSTAGQPYHLYAFGVAGIEAVKVELVTSGGRRIAAALGQQTYSVPVRWWIADYAGTEISSVVATDASGQ